MSSVRPTRYGAAAIAFHWLMFALVLCVGILGLLHDSWPDKASPRFWLKPHVLRGFLRWVVLTPRGARRLAHPPPPSVGGVTAQRLAAIVHFMLYALLFVIPIVGIVTFVYHGRAFNFGLFAIDLHVTSN